MIPRTILTSEHEQFRDSVRRFLDREVAPHHERWEEELVIDEIKTHLSGRALLVRLTAKGTKYRERLIKERRAADEKLREALASEEIASLLGLLKVVAELKL